MCILQTHFALEEATKFANKNDLEIVLAYYPPYHSKYNPIERCWGILENHWSGTLLNTWKGLEPVVATGKHLQKRRVYW